MELIEVQQAGLDTVVIKIIKEGSRWNDKIQTNQKGFQPFFKFFLHLLQEKPNCIWIRLASRSHTLEA